MLIGVPREWYRHEHRVGLTPFTVARLTRLGHTVFVEKDAGNAARFSNQEFDEAGAQIVYSSEEAHRRVDLVCRVGVLSHTELDLLKPGSIICAFHHLAIAPRDHLQRLIDLEVTILSYELVEDEEGGHPVLVPFSEMAGRMAIHIAACQLQNDAGGRGILLGDVPGVAPPTVVILGAGTVGKSAARQAVASGAHVVVLDQDMRRLREVNEALCGQVVTAHAGLEPIEKYTSIADVLIGAVLVPGAKAPMLVSEQMVKDMRPGSVIIDLSIDQGGCVETSRPSNPDCPVYVTHDVVHYCVPNITTNVARTASRALARAILPLLLAVTEKGPERAVREDPGLAAGVVLYKGNLVNRQVAEAHGLPVSDLASGLDSESNR